MGAGKPVSGPAGLVDGPGGAGRGLAPSLRSGPVREPRSVRLRPVREPRRRSGREARRQGRDRTPDHRRHRRPATGPDRRPSSDRGRRRRGGRQPGLQRPPPCRRPGRPPGDLQARQGHGHPDGCRRRRRGRLRAGAVRPQGRKADSQQEHRPDPGRRATRLAAGAGPGGQGRGGARGHPPGAGDRGRGGRARAGARLAPPGLAPRDLGGGRRRGGADRLSARSLGGGRPGLGPGHPRRRGGGLGHVPRRPPNRTADRRRRRGDPRRGNRARWSGRCASSAPSRRPGAA